MKRMRARKLITLHCIAFTIVGLLLGILYSFGGVAYDLASTGSFNAGTGLAFLALILMPIIFGVVGVIVGVVEVVVLSIFSKRLKSWDIDL